MSVDPQIATVLNLIAQSGGRALSASTAEQARAGFRTMTYGIRDPATLATVGSVENDSVDGPAGPVPVRIYRPETSGPAPTLVFFHGGAFVIGDLDTHDDHARLLCRDAGAVVVSVDYRLAPEHPFPAGLDDCFAATRWAVANISRLGADPGRVAVGGDSAGGNLAIAVTLAAREAGLSLAGQFLLYPCVDFRQEPELYPSRIANAEGFFLTADDMTWARELYLPSATAALDPRASVLLTEDLTGLPPAVVAVAGFDPLRDEGVAYAAALSKAGNHVLLREYPTLVHGFFGMGLLSQGAASAVSELGADLRALLG